MNIQTALAHPDALTFPEHHEYKTSWDSAGGHAVEQPTGHVVIYGKHGQRILLADPDGHPLHECLWDTSGSDIPVLRLARLFLDWNKWVGIKPAGLVNTMTLDLSTRPGWEQLTRDDLRAMAARAMNADISTVEFFYRDEDLEIRSDGTATIRQIKDAFYVLPQSSFKGARFMSCMSRMEWGWIDYLPVVELFLSLLPGTGSATFELIRGLYDDQQREAPRVLHYRGIPAYPSVGAFRLFSLFFSPSLPSGHNPEELFLDVNRSHEVEWLPTPEYPVRYIDEAQRLGVTVHRRALQKVTCWDDSSGLSYLAVTPSGEARADGRGARILNDELHLYDGDHHQVFQTRKSWNQWSQTSGQAWQAPPTSWRTCFPDGPPELSPAEAFSAVLLYPEQAVPIGEKESQPFIFDYLDDFLEEQTELRQFRDMADHVLLVRCEASLGACLRCGSPQQHTIWYEWPALAQKQAQQIWNSLHRQKELSWLHHYQFLPVPQQELTATYSPFDWIYAWIPFAVYDDPQELRQWSWFLANNLVPGGIGCLAGPRILERSLQEHRLAVLHAAQGTLLPTFKIHQAILQAGQLHPELTLWIVQQS